MDPKNYLQKRELQKNYMTIIRHTKNRSEFTISLLPDDIAAEEDEDEEGRAQITVQCPKALC